MTDKAKRRDSQGVVVEEIEILLQMEMMMEGRRRTSMSYIS